MPAPTRRPLATRASRDHRMIYCEAEKGDISMKKVVGIVMLGAAVIALPLGVRAQTVGPIPVSATVDSVQSFNCTIVQFQNGARVGEVTRMDFGTSFRGKNTDGSLAALTFSRHHQIFCGFLGPAGSITTSGTPLSNGTTTLPNGAYIQTPLQGQGGDPTKPLPGGSIVGTRSTAVGTHQVYSGPSGATVSWTVGITNDPNNGATEFIPPSQAAGTYNGTYTITYTPSS